MIMVNIVFVDQKDPSINVINNLINLLFTMLELDPEVQNYRNIYVVYILNCLVKIDELGKFVLF